ncbi:MAG: hypothetical protein HFJ51_01335 [Clostridia bacterium]|nr:hypothetical protein [Clostridia bacterium]
MKKEDLRTKDNIEKLGKVIEEKNKLPKEIKDKIASVRFQNIIFAFLVFAYLVALNLGRDNIPTDTYLIDLKVFSITLLVITIGIFEFAYRKDKSEFWLHGVEVMIIAVFTVYLIYFYSIYYNNFGNIVFSVASVYFIYYVVKILIMQRRTINKYKSLTDIGEIVKKKGRV